MKKLLIIGLFLLFVSGCTSVSSLGCKPDWVRAMPLTSNISDPAETCKTLCYYTSGMGTTSFKINMSMTCTDMEVENGSLVCRNQTYLPTCWCDVNKCGLSEIETS